MTFRSLMTRAVFEVTTKFVIPIIISHFVWGPLSLRRCNSVNQSTLQYIMTSQTQVRVELLIKSIHTLKLAYLSLSHGDSNLRRQVQTSLSPNTKYNLSTESWVCRGVSAQLCRSKKPPERSVQKASQPDAQTTSVSSSQ